MAVAERHPFATARSIKAREDSIETISKWMVSPLTTQPSAIAAVVGLAAALGGVERDRDRRRNFQRAGHRGSRHGRRGGLQLGDGALQQRILDSS